MGDGLWAMAPSIAAVPVDSRKSRREMDMVSLLMTVLWSRILALPHLGREPLRGVLRCLPQLGVLLEELGREAFVQSEHVVGDEHLAIAMDAGTDADGRNAH